MAVPKRRVSKARRDKRRSNVWKMDAPELVKCPNCGEYKRPHRICQSCGSVSYTHLDVYKRQILVYVIKSYRQISPLSPFSVKGFTLR